MDGSRKDVTDLHIVIDIKGLGDDVWSVKLLAYHTTADGVTIETYKHIEERGSVADDKLLVAVNGTENFF